MVNPDNNFFQQLHFQTKIWDLPKIE